MPPAALPLEQRFWPKVEKTDGCWNWKGALNTSGYGRLSLGGRGSLMARAHRVAYELVVGPIPDGQDLDHLCRNRACVKPAHLEPVSRQVNLLRGETITATNAVKTHCPAGHELTGDNLVRYDLERGTRKCRTCYNARMRAFRARRAAA